MTSLKPSDYHQSKYCNVTLFLLDKRHLSDNETTRYVNTDYQVHTPKKTYFFIVTYHTFVKIKECWLICKAVG